MRHSEIVSELDVHSGGDPERSVRVVDVDVRLRLMMPIGGDEDTLVSILLDALCELAEPVGDSDVVVLSAQEHDGSDR